MSWIVAPGLYEAGAYAAFVAFFMAIGFTFDTPTRRLFEGTHGQYAAALGINAAAFLAPVALCVIPVMRVEPAANVALILFALSVLEAYVLLRVMRLLPGIGPVMRALDRARLQRRLAQLGGAS